MLLKKLAIGLAAMLATIVPAKAESALDTIIQRGTINVGVGLGTPPYGLMDSSMQPDGYDVSVAKLIARDLGVKSITPCDPKTAERHSGYLVGGTSPFGLKTPLPIYVERSVLELPRIFINGGKRGFLVSLAPADMARALALTPIDAAQPI